MKPTKKTAAKRPSNPIVTKLLLLKYRINEAYRDNGMDTKDDKSYVMSLIDDVRKNHLTKLCHEDLLKCNQLWRTYK